VADRLRGLEIDDQLEVGRLPDRNVGWLDATKRFDNHPRCLAERYKSPMLEWFPIATLAHPLVYVAYRSGESSTTIGGLRSFRCNR
jgi:hypothetical protein